MAGASPRGERATAPPGRDLRAALAAAPQGSPDSASGHAHPHGPPKPRDPIGQRVGAATPLPPPRPNWRGCLPLPGRPRGARSRPSGTTCCREWEAGHVGRSPARPPAPRTHLQNGPSDAASLPGAAAANRVSARRAQGLAGPRRAAPAVVRPPAGLLPGVTPRHSPSRRSSVVPPPRLSAAGESVPWQRRGLTAARPTPRARRGNGARQPRCRPRLRPSRRACRCGSRARALACWPRLLATRKQGHVPALRTLAAGRRRRAGPGPPFLGLSAAAGWVLKGVARTACLPVTPGRPPGGGGDSGSRMLEDTVRPRRGWGISAPALPSTGWLGCGNRV